MIRAIPLIFILFGCSLSGDIDWAEELVVQTNVRENLQVALEACAEFSKDLIGEEYKLNYQTDRLGLSHDDPAWFELAQIYENFYEQACGHVDIDELSALYVEEYRTRFSEAELQAIVEFHNSDAGSKFVVANSEINILVNQLVNQKMAEGSVDAQFDFERRLQEFWLEQEFSPNDSGLENQL